MLGPLHAGHVVGKRSDIDACDPVVALAEYGRLYNWYAVNGKVVASMQRQAAKGEFRANVHRGGTASVVRITSEERKLALKATKALNLAVAGVDIIRSNKGPLLLEVNSSPGLEGIEQATGTDIANAMVQAIERKLKFNV